LVSVRACNRVNERFLTWSKTRFGFVGTRRLQLHHSYGRRLARFPQGVARKRWGATVHNWPPGGLGYLQKKWRAPGGRRACTIGGGRRKRFGRS
jgi:hypothetical protein